MRHLVFFAMGQIPRQNPGLPLYPSASSTSGAPVAPFCFLCKPLGGHAAAVPRSRPQPLRRIEQNHGRKSYSLRCHDLERSGGCFNT